MAETENEILLNNMVVLIARLIVSEHTETFQGDK